MNQLSDAFKAHIVQLILMGKADEALEELSERLGVVKPKLKVGRVKGKGKALGVYVSAKETIYVSEGRLLREPFVILHEFYHHLRMFHGKHRGTEKHANKFALDFIRAYLSYLDSSKVNNTLD